MKVHGIVLVSLIASGSNVSNAAASSLGMKTNLAAATMLLAKVKNAVASTSPLALFSQTGPCANSDGYGYNYIEMYTPNYQPESPSFSKENPEPCINWCKQANMDKLVGVTIGYAWDAHDMCWCQLTNSDGVSTSQYTNPSPAGLRIHMTGNGQVVKTLPYFHQGLIWCWRNEVS